MHSRTLMRRLPLQALKKMHLPANRDTPRFAEEMALQVNGSAEVIKEREIDNLSAQLRMKYPDAATGVCAVRMTMRANCTREAMDLLIGILVAAVMDELLHEDCSRSELPWLSERGGQVGDYRPSLACVGAIFDT